MERGYTESSTWVPVPAEGYDGFYESSTERTGFRTLFNSFHHMRPDEGTALLEDACRSRSPILVVEANDPGPTLYLFMLLFVPLLVLLSSPFIRPFRWSRIFFTYPIPLLPLLIAWDGLVSLLRIYSPEAMPGIAKEISCEQYEWKAGRIQSGAAALLYLLGKPR